MRREQGTRRGDKNRTNDTDSSYFCAFFVVCVAGFAREKRRLEISPDKDKP